MRKTDVLIVGGGQAGLAMSHCLAERGIAHVVVERGRIADRWVGETWSSLRLLTPNWMTRLPGWRYAGADPDGFMTRDEVVGFLRGYAASFAAPVVEGVAVERVTPRADGHVVATSAGTWLARAVVVATGQCDRPSWPAAWGRIGLTVHQIHASQYRSPGLLPPGGVLVVGGSSSGVQIADEIARAGRPVVLSTGSHIRMPRSYRGRDIFWWLDRAGVMAEPVAALPNAAAAYRQPSLQLVGRPDRADIDFASLQAIGVRLAGRLTAAETDRIGFADDLAASVATSDLKLERLLDRIDRHADADGAPAGDRPRPMKTSAGLVDLSLRREGIRTIVWATGYRRSFDWLPAAAVDGRGDLKHEGGATPVPGLHGLGFRFLARRNSNFIDGVGADARATAERIAADLRQTSRSAA